MLVRFGLSLLFNDPIKSRRSPVGILRCVLGDGSSVDITYFRASRPTAPASFSGALATCRALEQRWNNEHPILPIEVTPVVIGPPAPQPGPTNGPPDGGPSDLSVPEKIIEALTGIRPPRNETPIATAAACGAICLQLYVDSRTGLVALRGLRAVGGALRVARPAIAALRGGGRAASRVPITEFSRLLPQSTRIPNAGGAIRSFVTKQDEIYYRVFSDNPTGRFLTKVRPTSRARAVEGLALPPQNQAQFVPEGSRTCGHKTSSDHARSQHLVGAAGLSSSKSCWIGCL